MTVNTTVIREIKQGDGIAVSWASGVEYGSDARAVLAIRYFADKTITPKVLTYNVDYTIGGEGGNFILTTTSFTLPVGDELVITVNPEFTQTDDFQYGSGIPAKVMERAIDDLTIQNLVQRDSIDRGAVSALNSPMGYQIVFPSPSEGLYLGWGRLPNGEINLVNLVGGGGSGPGEGGVITGDRLVTLFTGGIDAQAVEIGPNKSGLYEDTSGKLVVTARNAPFIRAGANLVELGLHYDVATGAIGNPVLEVVAVPGQTHVATMSSDTQGTRPGVVLQTEDFANASARSDVILKPANGGVVEADSTGAIGLPSGTTSQRPANPTNGYLRYNAELGYVEQYLAASGWGPIAPAAEPPSPVNQFKELAPTDFAANVYDFVSADFNTKIVIRDDVGVTGGTLEYLGHAQYPELEYTNTGGYFSGTVAFISLEVAPNATITLQAPGNIVAGGVAQGSTYTIQGSTGLQIFSIELRGDDLILAGQVV